MESLYILRNGKESATSVIMIEELKAEYQAVFLTIRIMDQITSKLWSNQSKPSNSSRSRLQMPQL